MFFTLLFFIGCVMAEHNPKKILLVYSGGTIGMKQDPDTLALVPFNFDQIEEEVPELKKFGCWIDS